MTEPENSPFKLNRSRLVILGMGLLVLLIALSSAMGGMSGYQALKEAAAAQREGTAPLAEPVAPPP